jgi:hypothetical protein
MIFKKNQELLFAPINLSGKIHHGGQNGKQSDASHQ